MRTHLRRNGFTLVELLTVIGIIAVLSAILFPVFARARAKARQARCLSNLQQIGVAIETYVQDNHGFLPTWSITHPNVPAPPQDAATSGGWQLDSGLEPNEPDPQITTWDLSIMQYLKQAEVLVCPDNPNPRAQEARSYAIAQYTQRPQQVGGAWIALGGYKDDIPLAGETVLLFEKGNNPPGSWGDALGQNVYQDHGGDAPAPDASAEEVEGFQMWHQEGKNFLYVDYHADWSKATQGPFANKPIDADRPGTCEDWGKPASSWQGDWPEP
jgi:prepilin-type N-terminal cleavage/methylation domain-containing protein